MSNNIPTIAPAKSDDLVTFATRHNGWTAERQRGFCEALACCGRVEESAASVGMSRESAYRLRRRDAGRAFALAWDAALLLARDRLIDDAYELAFAGAVDQIIRDGKVIGERRRRDPRMLLATIEKLDAKKELGSIPIRVVAQEFETFLDCLEVDVDQQAGQTALFMSNRASRFTHGGRDQMRSSSDLLQHAQSASPNTRISKR